MSAILAPVLATLTYIIATTLYNVIIEWRHESPELISLNSHQLIYGLKFYLLHHAIAFFGAVYFKSKPMVKSISLMMIILFVLTLCAYVAIETFPSLFFHDPSSQELAQQPNMRINIVSLNFAYASGIGLTLFFWLLSLIRLKEIDAR